MAKFNSHINQFHIGSFQLNQSWSLQSMPFGSDDSRLNNDGIYLPFQQTKTKDIRI